MYGMYGIYMVWYGVVWYYMVWYGCRYVGMYVCMDGCKYVCISSSPDEYKDAI